LDFRFQIAPILNFFFQIGNFFLDFFRLVLIFPKIGIFALSFQFVNSFLFPGNVKDGPPESGSGLTILEFFLFRQRRIRLWRKYSL